PNPAKSRSVLPSRSTANAGTDAPLGKDTLHFTFSSSSNQVTIGHESPGKKRFPIATTPPNGFAAMSYAVQLGPIEAVMLPCSSSTASCPGPYVSGLPGSLTMKPVSCSATCKFDAL